MIDKDLVAEADRIAKIIEAADSGEYHIGICIGVKSRDNKGDCVVIGNAITPEDDCAFIKRAVNGTTVEGVVFSDGHGTKVN